MNVKFVVFMAWLFWLAHGLGPSSLKKGFHVGFFYLVQVLAVPMLAPRSYTREDVVELQCHGTEVCLRRVLRACIEAGARLAEPGCLLI